MAENEWENDSNFLQALYIVNKKLGQIFFHNLLVNLFKQRYISSVTSYKYLNKLISEVYAHNRLHDFSVTIPRCYKDVYVNSFFLHTARMICL